MIKQLVRAKLMRVINVLMMQPFGSVAACVNSFLESIVASRCIAMFTRVSRLKRFDGFGCGNAVSAEAREYE